MATKYPVRIWCETCGAYKYTIQDVIDDTWKPAACAGHTTRDFVMRACKCCNCNCDMNDHDLIHVKDLLPHDAAFNVAFATSANCTARVKNTGSVAGFGIAAVDDHLDHLTAYWRMEETGAAARVDIVGNNDAAAVGVPDTRAGKSNLAYDGDGDGSNECLVVQHHADIQPTTGLAIVLWAYRDGTTHRHGLFKKTDSCYYLRCLTGGTALSFGAYQGNGVGKWVDDGVMGTGAWHQVIAMACDGFVRLYVDGAATGTPIAYDNTIKFNANELFLFAGDIVASYSEWDGGADEAAFFKDISFADEEERLAFVAGFWNAGAGRFYETDSVGEANLDVQDKLTAASSQLGGGGATPTEFSTDGTLGGNSDTAIPTEKAVKTYADSQGWKLIAESELGAPAASVSFTNIPGTYDALVVVCEARTDRAAEIDYINLTMNSDGGANYDMGYLYMIPDARTCGAARGGTAAGMLTTEAANSRANNFAGGMINIFGYARTDAEKSFNCFNGVFGDVSADADVIAYLRWGRWRSTSAVTTITLTPLVGPNFVSGSHFRLYGIVAG